LTTQHQITAVITNKVSLFFNNININIFIFLQSLII